MSIDGGDISLRPFSAAELLALRKSADEFERTAGLRAGNGLRDFLVSDAVSPSWLAKLRASGGVDPWRYGFAVVDGATRTAIGTASFKGPPDDTGMVEIAYGIVPSCQGRGLATLAARALIEYARRDARVRLVRAHTLPERNASTSVLQKCRFEFVGAVHDAEDGPVWRWSRTACILDEDDRADLLRLFR
jgi:RimJ/RimL family protein N-acetyltransferase